MAKKLLTVIIPTWNRCEYLKKNLDILLPLAELHKEELSVYISDNASDDDTPVIIEQAKKAYPKLVRSFRQAKNIGSAGNFTDSISKIDSEYFVLLGDDDYILPYYFDFVLRILKEHPDVDWLCYNGMCVTDDNQIISLLTSLKVDTHEKCYDNGIEMVSDFFNNITLMSQNVYRRELFELGAKNFSEEDYPGYSWFATMCHQIVGKKSYYCDIILIEQSRHSGCPWASNAPWYYVYGLGKLFKDLDVYYLGLYASWLKYINNQKQIKEAILSQLSQSRCLYKERVKEMRKYSFSKLFDKQLYVYAAYPMPIAQLFDKCLRAYALYDKSFKAAFNQ